MKSRFCPTHGQTQRLEAISAQTKDLPVFVSTSVLDGPCRRTCRVSTASLVSEGGGGSFHPGLEFFWGHNFKIVPSQRQDRSNIQRSNFSAMLRIIPFPRRVSFPRGVPPTSDLGHPIRGSLHTYSGVKTPVPVPASQLVEK